ncbi:hypothetical protein C4K04_3867 [Pseudomonas chlororaphis]|uniref:Uncharacterized protein n=1 Tax=Pseudomonas chlororaphis TaxID=587753 RepID=A0A3G7TTD0_9PSED|nr:hypothetical protein C4K04_3867 [Pseudomonas chlororaphis]
MSLTRGARLESGDGRWTFSRARSLLQKATVPVGASLLAIGRPP